MFSRNTAPGVQQLREEELRAVAEEAHFWKLKTAAHAHGADGIKAAIRAGIDTIDQVEKLQFQYLEAHGEPEADEDEFLVEDLIGLRVLDENGDDLGEVDDVIVNPAHETLVVGEILIPFVEQFVDAVDFDEEIVRVRLIPGMRGEPDAESTGAD